MRVSASAAAHRRVDDANRAERLAAALDLQSVGAGAGRWTVHVFGVHDDGRYLWIQAASAPDGNHCIVLKVSAWTTAHHALATLNRLPPPVLGCLRIPDIRQESLSEMGFANFN